MARNRVLSFMSSFSNRDSQRSPTPGAFNPPASQQGQQNPYKQDLSRQNVSRQRPSTPPSQQQQWGEGSRDSSQPRERAPVDRSSSRPMSMVQTYQPPLMELTQDTLPELQPIFTFLNSHSNKLYQEGYFLKLDDQNSHGKPNADRTWTECFAQLVGTILSLWDAAELDAAGQDGEVLPKFINLTDASIKMIDSLPTRSNDDQPLQNVLSISTAGKNRYLLHFNSHHSLIQWTAGIRLAMFEHSSLQEAYTGALIAGKGKALNNISIIMERSKIKHEDWVRVRFGAGTPWRRCWCVVTPPDEKEFQRLQKEINKKKSAYDRSRPPILRGDVKFYDTKKTKRATPIAQISSIYSAFAIYPQSKPLIDASTLVKLEGIITIFSNPPHSTEGFVFVMPEVHPAVSGFEMMLRWLFPVWDTFGLYGRPGRLIADTSSPQSLMFAMPKERRYGYLEILDVSGLILTEGSQGWSDMEWRRNLKDLTAKRMAAIADGSRGSRYGSRRSARNSFGAPRTRVEFNDGASVRSNPSVSWGQPPADTSFGGTERTDSAPPAAAAFQPQSTPATPKHQRSVSDTHKFDRYQNQGPPLYDGGFENGPTPPPHGIGFIAPPQGSALRYERGLSDTAGGASSEDELSGTRTTPVPELQNIQDTRTPEPVARPPAFAHAPGTLPAAKPYHSPELRRAKSRISTTTLAQMAGASGATGAEIAAMQASGGDHPRTSDDQRRQNVGRYSEERGQRGVLSDPNKRGVNANPYGVAEGLVAARPNRLSFEYEATPPANAPSTGEHSFSNYHASEQPPQQHLNQYGPTNISAPQPPRHLLQLEPQRSVLADATSTSHSQNSAAPVAPIQVPPSRDHPQGHGYTSSTDSAFSQSSGIQSRQSILRKPLPTRNSLTSPERPVQEARSRSADNVVDQARFDKGIPRETITHGLLAPETQIHPQHSNTSLYEDAQSTASPDYSSTRASTDTKPSFERPRAGVMRTVGGPEEGYPGSSAANNDIKTSIPDFDFGPTMRYAPNQLPSQPNNPRKTSPARRQSPARHPGQQSRNVITPEPSQYRNEGNTGPGSRTVPWQPGMASVTANSPGRQAISPEQFVQQRAAAATPLYAHQRQPSGNLMRSGTPTPPLAHSRNNSSDMLQRPNSRGSAAALGASGTGEYSTRLSAKGQEHVARITGTPLITNSGGDGRGAAPNTGLVGAIDAREREKRELKQGINSQAVQQAMMQRQQQQVQAQQQAQFRGQQQPQYIQGQPYPQQYQAGPPQGQYASGGQYPNPYPTAPQYPPQPRQTSYVNPGAAAYAQGGGFASPQPRVLPNPAEQQQQYFQTQGPAQGRGRGGGRGK